MTPRPPLLLVGNALATMVAATLAARGGRAVTVVNGTGNWGGHFSRAKVGDAWFDPGMITYEFTSFSPQATLADVSSYDPRVRSDVGRFCDVVRDFVHQYQVTRTIETPVMRLADSLLDDVIIANRVEALRRLPFAQQVEDELTAMPPPGMLHASFKRRTGAYDDADLATVSRANHGTTLHDRVIEPYCRKLLGVSSGELLARFHRVAWLPLFYPETLVSTLRGSPDGLPPTEFSYPVGANVGELADRLRAGLLEAANVRIVSARPARVERRDAAVHLTLDSGETLTAGRMAWSLSLAELLKVAGAQTASEPIARSSVALVFVRVPRGALMRSESIASIVDAQWATYRITNQSTCAGRPNDDALLVVEINPGYAGCTGPDAAQRLADKARSELVALDWVGDAGVVDVLGTKVLMNALMLPTRANRDAHAREEQAVVDAFPDVARLGPASGFFTSSLNDQIVQGIKLAQEELA